MSNQLELVNELRQQLDQIVLDGEVAHRDEDVKESASSFFSDQDLIQRMSDGTRFVVSQVRAEAVPGYIEIIEPFEGDNTNAPLFYRLLASRVDVGNENAKRTTFGAIRKYHNNVGPPDECNPIFVFEDYELKVYNGCIDPEGSVASVVGVPKDKMKIVNGPFIFDSGINKITGIESEDEGGLVLFYDSNNSVIFSTYVIYDTVTSTYVLMDETPGSSFFETHYYTVNIGAFHSLGKNMEPLIKDYAYASALGTIGLYEQSVMAQQRLLRNLEPYMYSRRDSSNAL